MTTTQTNLKPCPFCGEKFELQTWNYPATPAADWQAAQGPMVAIICSSCGALGPRGLDGSETALWNQRKPFINPL